jgi:hypothetical protein
MSLLFLDIPILVAGTVLIYIHMFEATEAKRKAIQTKRKKSEDRMPGILERRFSLILEKKLKDEDDLRHENGEPDV